MSRTEHERSGRRAETAAALLLALKGFRIAARRYRTPVGEIDLVGRRGRLVVFVEVKRRLDPSAAAAAVTSRQRARIARAAAHWLARNAAADPVERVRFDVVLVVPGSVPRHLPDAWRPEPGLNG